MDQFDTVHARHVEVGNQQVDRGAVVELLQRLFSVRRFFDFVAGLAENAGNAQEDGGGVVHQHDFAHGVPFQ